MSARARAVPSAGPRATSSSSRSPRSGPDSGTSPSCSGLACLSLRRAPRVLEPLSPAVAAAVPRVEVRRLDLGRRRAWRTDELVVDLADRRDLGGVPTMTPGRGGEVGADQRLFDDAMTEILRDLDHRVARDADQDRRREIGRVDDAVADDEDAFARAVGDRSPPVSRIASSYPARFASPTASIELRSTPVAFAQQVAVGRRALPARHRGADTVLRPSSAVTSPTART